MMRSPCLNRLLGVTVMVDGGDGDGDDHGDGGDGGVARGRWG